MIPAFGLQESTGTRRYGTKRFRYNVKKRARTFGRGTVRRGTVRRKKNVSFG